MAKRKPKADKIARHGDGDRHGAAVDVVTWIERYINHNDVAVGDSLPTEEEIVRETKLSRTSVREGLTKLRALGLVETRRKRGMRLMRSVALLDFVRLLSSNVLPPELASHVKGFRSAVELGLGPEVFRQCEPADVQKLQRIYEQMVAEADNPEVWPRLDREFHLSLVSISRNKLAVWFHQLLDPFFRAYAPSEYPVKKEILDRHRQIVQALATGDPYLFDHALREHHLRKLSAATPEDDH
ncbi:MAG: FadR family transcriptional regulator [Pirellulales bacterium]|nr:FadR family transcriptional regulator [Pirellulales bacterium]